MPSDTLGWTMGGLGAPSHGTPSWVVCVLFPTPVRVEPAPEGAVSAGAGPHFSSGLLLFKLPYQKGIFTSYCSTAFTSLLKQQAQMVNMKTSLTIIIMCS